MHHLYISVFTYHGVSDFNKIKHLYKKRAKKDKVILWRSITTKISQRHDWVNLFLLFITHLLLLFSER